MPGSRKMNPAAGLFASSVMLIPRLRSGPLRRPVVPDDCRAAAPALLVSARGFDRGDVDRHHRLEGALGGGAVGVRHRVHQGARGDLPRQAVLVLAPAAGAFRTAVVDDRACTPAGTPPRRT